jgi:hypothetical protein
MSMCERALSGEAGVGCHHSQRGGDAKSKSILSENPDGSRAGAYTTMVHGGDAKAQVLDLESVQEGWPLAEEPSEPTLGYVVR